MGRFCSCYGTGQVVVGKEGTRFMEIKQCSTCHQVLSLQSFGLVTHRRKLYYRTQCKRCRCEYQKDYWKRNKPVLNAKQRAYGKLHQHQNNLRRNYGITTVQYEEKFKAQNGLCAICCNPPTSKRRLGVDHNHLTSQIRGLLCSKCNQAIGLFNESLFRLDNAKKYLNLWRK